jgi:hypothetical protein
MKALIALLTVAVVAALARLATATTPGESARIAYMRLKVHAEMVGAACGLAVGCRLPRRQL